MTPEEELVEVKRQLAVRKAKDVAVLEQLQRLEADMRALQDLYQP